MCIYMRCGSRVSTTCPMYFAKSIINVSLQVEEVRKSIIQNRINALWSCRCIVSLGVVCTVLLHPYSIVVCFLLLSFFVIVCPCCCKCVCVLYHCLMVLVVSLMQFYYGCYFIKLLLFCLQVFSCTFAALFALFFLSLPFFLLLLFLLLICHSIPQSNSGPWSVFIVFEQSKSTCQHIAPANLNYARHVILHLIVGFL